MAKLGGKIIAIIVIVAIFFALGGANYLTGWGSGVKAGPDILSFVKNPTRAVIEFFTGPRIEKRVNISAILTIEPQELGFDLSLAKKLKLDYKDVNASVLLNQFELKANKSTILELTNFSGRIVVFNKVSFAGEAMAADINAVAFSSGTKIIVGATNVTFDNLYLFGTSPLYFDLRNASGTIEWDGKGTYKATNENISIKGFEGDIAISNNRREIALTGLAAISAANLTIPG